MCILCEELDDHPTSQTEFEVNFTSRNLEVCAPFFLESELILFPQVAASRSLNAWWVEDNRPQATIQVEISLDENQLIMYLSAGGSRGASHREAAQD